MRPPPRGRPARGGPRPKPTSHRGRTASRSSRGFVLSSPVFSPCTPWPSVPSLVKLFSDPPRLNAHPREQPRHDRRHGASAAALPRPAGGGARAAAGRPRGRATAGAVRGAGGGHTRAAGGALPRRHRQALGRLSRAVPRRPRLPARRAAGRAVPVDAVRREAGGRAEGPARPAADRHVGPAVRGGPLPGAPAGVADDVRRRRPGAAGDARGGEERRPGGGGARGAAERDRSAAGSRTRRRWPRRGRSSRGSGWSPAGSWRPA